ncbi:MAG: gluconate 2-dehydrogenase subunit 3 family protein [Bryobacterales bacterium]|nr:gluconate 2-dehydrogenase subunit 3 family protein [Bryobacterales bacterium]
MSENRETSRRGFLGAAGLALGALPLNAQHAHHAHQAVRQEKAKGPYRPRFFTPQEYRTLAKLADLIIPADEHSPGAVEAGAPEFIDFLASNSPELAAVFTGGLAWLDGETKRRYSAAFVDAKPGDQAALLDLIAYRRNDTPELGPGIEFFEWARKLTVDAFYTSPEGIKDLGFQGNGAMAEFSVPREAVEYALKRSGLG